MKTNYTQFFLELPRLTHRKGFDYQDKIQFKGITPAKDTKEQTR